ncbi:hypothetical protein E2562_008272 [Oryza meyeriana var. granulata]|uniref:GEX2 N-terminal Ig-like domain-containing protein n=1 Tax=Oryza meyeriana var. granulata TaxID=110450 RepID=A0A6G1DG59_9ORYZ|nr:hypothetical protein E2562_008272 [Oryza meyeriana var. granulata]
MLALVLAQDLVIVKVKTQVKAKAKVLNMVRGVAKDMVKKMAMAQDMVRGVAKGMVKEMALAQDMVRGMAKAMANGKALAQDMARGMVRAMVMGKDQGRIMVKAMAQDMAKDQSQAMTKDMIKVQEVDMEMVRAQAMVRAMAMAMTNGSILPIHPPRPPRPSTPTKNAGRQGGGGALRRDDLAALLVASLASSLRDRSSIAPVNGTAAFLFSARFCADAGAVLRVQLAQQQGSVQCRRHGSDHDQGTGPPGWGRDRRSLTFTATVNGRKGNNTYITDVEAHLGGESDTWSITFVPLRAGEFVVLVSEECFGVGESFLQFTVTAGDVHPSASLISWTRAHVAGSKAFVSVVPRDALGNGITRGTDMPAGSGYFRVTREMLLLMLSEKNG